jgi:hypothetical protein
VLESVKLRFIALYTNVQCATAFLQVDQLQYLFPSSNDELCQASNVFKAISSNEVIDEYVACVDGFLFSNRTKISSVVPVGS